MTARSLTYPFRLVRNSIFFFRKAGLRASFLKALDVIKGWFRMDSVVLPISRIEYAKWIKDLEKSPLSGAQKNITPLVSILMPVYNVEEKFIMEAIESVKSQTYGNWELCLFDDASTKDYIKPLLEKLAASDKRIKIGFSEINEHIPLTTNKAFGLSSGEYLLLMDNDDLISPEAVEAYVECLNRHPEADLIYCDEDKIDLENIRFDPFFKPNPSPEMLLETMYPVHAFFSRRIFERVGMMRKGFEGSQDYDLVLRVFDATEEVYHIPHILYHWRITETSTAVSTENKPYVIDAAKKSISEAITRRGYTGSVTGNNYPFKCNIDIVDNPSVEIIIPNKDKLKFISRAVESITTKTTYSNYSITIVDNQSVEQETEKFYKESLEKGIKKIDYDSPFNFSAMNNFAVSQSTADYVIFLNNDTEIISKQWIEEMLMWAQMPRVGAVGAKLLYPNGRVQHAGIVMGMGPRGSDNSQPVANHLYYREVEGTLRQFNQLNMVQNVSAVTAACLMIKRDRFAQVGGFNEEDLAVAFNDADLCLKLHEKGFRNVYTPHARLIHYESMSRSSIPAEKEIHYMYSKWTKYIKSDPYYNPNFDKETILSYVLPKL